MPVINNKTEKQSIAIRAEERVHVEAQSETIDYVMIMLSEHP